MNDTTQTESNSELDTLKARADMMGIKYHPNTGVDKLRAKIDNALDDQGLTVNETKMLNHAEFKKAQLNSRRKNAAKLVRINVACMDPAKAEWEGEIISVGSAKLGTFKKYIPFNTSDGWHVPNIIYEHLKERECSVFHTVKDHLGQKVRKSKNIKAFSIEVLPPLSKTELKALAQRQAMAEGKE